MALMCYTWITLLVCLYPYTNGFRRTVEDTYTRESKFTRVKLGIFGQTAKFGQPRSLYHTSVIEIKNKLTKQTVKILMRRLIWISIVCKYVSEFA